MHAVLIDKKDGAIVVEFRGDCDAERAILGLIVSADKTSALREVNCLDWTTYGKVLMGAHFYMLGEFADKETMTTLFQERERQLKERGWCRIYRRQS